MLGRTVRPVEASSGFRSVLSRQWGHAGSQIRYDGWRGRAGSRGFCLGQPKEKGAPEDAGKKSIHTESKVPFPFLYWGFVSQDIVKEKVIPFSLEKMNAKPLLPLVNEKTILTAFELTATDIKTGCAQAYNFVADNCVPGGAVFEEKYSNMIYPPLGRLYDSQIRQFEPYLTKSDAKMIEIHEIHDVVLVHTFPALIIDRVKENGEPRKYWSSSDSILTSWLSESTRLILDGLVNMSTKLAVEVVLKTTETAYFGPEAGVKRDCEHVLMFSSENSIVSVLRNGADLNFRLMNVNEVLSIGNENSGIPEWDEKATVFNSSRAS